MILLVTALSITLSNLSFAAKPAEQKPPKFRATAIWDIGSNLYTVGSQDYFANSSLVLIPSYRVLPNWNLSLILSGSQTLTGARDFLFFDPSAVVARLPVSLNPYVSWMPALGVVFPMSERSQDRESLLTAVRPSLRVVSSFSRLNTPVIRNLSLVYEVAVSRSLHEFTTAANGSVNTAWRLSNWLNLNYSPSDRWFVSADFIRNAGWTYTGASRHSFSLGETVGYRATQRLTVSVGHTNEGDVLRANGLASNVSFFNSATSRVFTSIMVNF